MTPARTLDGRPRALVFGLLLAAVPATAWAQELNLGAQFEAEYNSNFRASPKNPDASISNRFGPIVELSDPYGRLTAELEYQGFYDWLLDERGFNQWENYLNGVLGYAIGPRTQLTVYDSFRDVASLRFSRAEAEDGTSVLDPGRDPFLRNAFNWELEHQFSQRLRGSLRGRHDWVDFEDNLDRNDSQSMNTEYEFGYSPTRVDWVGIGSAFTYQAIEESGTASGSRSQSYQSFLTWSHRFTDDFRFSVRGGPAVVVSTSSNSVSRQNVALFQNPTTGNLEAFQFSACTAEPTGPGVPPQLQGIQLESNCDPATTVPLPPTYMPQVQTYRITGAGTGDTSATFFGAFSVSKRWTDWSARASYTRNQSTAAGDGGTSALDSVRMTLDWAPQRLWSGFVSAGWSRRKRISKPLQIEYAVEPDTTVTPAIALRSAVIGVRSKRQNSKNQFTASAGVRRRVTRQMNASFELRYRFQDRERTNQSSGSSNVLLAVLKIDYTLAPIRF